MKHTHKFIDKTITYKKSATYYSFDHSFTFRQRYNFKYLSFKKNNVMIKIFQTYSKHQIKINAIKISMIQKIQKNSKIQKNAKNQKNQKHF